MIRCCRFSSLRPATLRPTRFLVTGGAGRVERIIGVQRRPSAPEASIPPRRPPCASPSPQQQVSGSQLRRETERAAYQRCNNAPACLPPGPAVPPPPRPPDSKLQRFGVVLSPSPTSPPPPREERKSSAIPHPPPPPSKRRSGLRGRAFLRGRRRLGHFPCQFHRWKKLLVPLQRPALHP